MQGLLSIATGIDRINRFFGIVASVAVASACLISALNALSRYALGISSNAFLEIQWQLYAAAFLLGAPWVFKLNEHVRVDLLYSIYRPRTKLWVDVFGLVVFLFPVCVIMLEMAYPWAFSSLPSCAVTFVWESVLGLSLPWFSVSCVGGEASGNPGGLPVWPVKLLIPLGFTLLLLQGVAELIRRVAALRGEIALDLTYEKPVQ